MNHERSRSKNEEQTILGDFHEHDRAEDELLKLRKAIEASGEIIFLTDQHSIFTYINPEFTRLYGYIPEEVVGKTTPRILKSGKMTAQDDEPYSKKILSKESVRCEWVNRCKDGRLVSIEGSINPILDQDENVIGFVTVQRDITRRKQAEEEIRQREKELTVLNAVAATIGQSLDLKQILTSALDEILRLKILNEQMFGMLFLLDEQRQTLHLAAQSGSPPGHPCLSSPVNVGECLCGQAAKYGKVIVCQNNFEDERHVRCWSKMFLHKDICIPIKAHGAILGVMEIRMPETYEVVDSDIRLLVAIADQIGVAIENAQLREIRERTIIDERERIARELHDGLSQLLGYVNTKAMAARLLLHKHQYKAVDQLLVELEEAAKELFVDVREAILGLKMAGRSCEDLSTNLTDFIAHFSRLTGLPVELSMDPEVDNIPLLAETEYQLMRIVQEALNNIRKHASASQAWVNVQVNDNKLELTISDDGIGYDPKAQSTNLSGHLGLNTMRERAESLGAKFQISSLPKRGVQVRVLLALSAEASE